jgi:hypothetical protein
VSPYRETSLHKVMIVGVLATAIVAASHKDDAA